MEETTQIGFSLELPPGDFAAYIFDCDGTLADTMPTHYRAWQEALGEHAANLAARLFLAVLALPVGDLGQARQRRDRTVHNAQDFAEGNRVGRPQKPISASLSAP